MNTATLNSLSVEERVQFDLAVPPSQALELLERIDKEVATSEERLDHIKELERDRDALLEFVYAAAKQADTLADRYQDV
jgi:hypothetical protein